MSENTAPQISNLAKLTRPDLRLLFHRKRLYKWLDDTADARLVWVSSPAGSGKTSLISGYLARKKSPVLWYQIDSGDEDPASFFYYLRMVAEAIIGPDAAQLPPLTQEYIAGIETFGRNFIRQLSSLLPTKATIVFDNFQDLTENSPLHNSIVASLGELTRGQKIIALSRYDPPHQYARLKANQSFKLLGRPELALTDDECAGVIALHDRGKRSTEEVAKLNSRVGGWLAGLMLLMQSTKSANIEDIDPERGDVTDIFSYFAHELFQGSSAEVQTLLLKTSLFPEFSLDDARSIIDTSEVVDTLEYIEHHNYFLARLQGSPVRYRYHPLFKSFLSNHCHRHFKQEELQELVRQTIDRLVAAGNEVDAIELAISEKRWDIAIPLLLQHAVGLYQMGRGSQIAQWLKKIPEILVTEQPWLMYWSGAVTVPYDPAGARSILETAYVRFKEQKEASGMLLSWCMLVDSFYVEHGDFHPLDYWIEEIESSGLLAPDKLGLMPPEIQARLTSAMLIALMYRQPQHPQMQFWAGQATQLFKYSDNPQLQVYIGNHLVVYQAWWVGDLAAASSMLGILKSMSDQIKTLPVIQITTAAFEAVLCWMRAENQQCVQASHEGLALADETGVHVLDGMLCGNGVFGAMSDGEREIAFGLMEKMVSTIRPNQYLDHTWYHSLLGWYYHINGEAALALKHAELSYDFAEKTGTPLFISIAKNEYGRLMALHDNKERGLKVIHEANEISRSFNCGPANYCTYKNLAKVYFHYGDYGQGLENLVHFLKIGQHFNFRNYVWWHPEETSQLYSVALENNIDVEYVSSMIIQRELTPPRNTLPPDNWPYPIKIHTLGRFGILLNGKPLSFGSKAQAKPIELLKALIANGGRDVSEETLTDLVWPDSEGDAAHSAFTTNVSRLRKLLGHDNALIVKQHKLSLNEDWVWLDVNVIHHQLATLDQQLNGDVLPTVHDYHAWSQHLQQYGGDFLKGEHHAWILTERERLRTHWLNAVRQLGAYLNKQHDWEELIKLYEYAFDQEPVTEDLCRELMQAYDHTGRRQDAVRIYQRCHEALETTLGLSPHADTETLYASLTR